jgi:hypothetical protein
VQHFLAIPEEFKPSIFFIYYFYAKRHLSQFGQIAFRSVVTFFDQVRGDLSVKLHETVMSKEWWMLDALE